MFGKLQKVYNTHNSNAKEKGTEEMLETIMIENIPKLMSDIKPQIQEVQEIPGKINMKNHNNNKKTYTRHIIFKLQKIKYNEKNPEGNQRKTKLYV